MIAYSGKEFERFSKKCKELKIPLKEIASQINRYTVVFKGKEYVEYAQKEDYENPENYIPEFDIMHEYFVWDMIFKTSKYYFRFSHYIDDENVGFEETYLEIGKNRTKQTALNVQQGSESFD